MQKRENMAMFRKSKGDFNQLHVRMRHTQASQKVDPSGAMLR